MTTLPASTPALRAPALPALFQLWLSESRRLTREPMFLVGTVGFPVLFYSLVGMPRGDMTPEMSRAALLNLSAFSLVSLTLFSFGANVAAERTGGWLRLLRASPMPPGAYLGAKVLAAWVYGAASVALLMAYAGLVGGVWLGLWPSLLAVFKLLLGASPLVALGLAIGFLVRPAGATVVANVANLLLVFAGGLAMPLSMLPGFLTHLAPWLPTFHLGAVARSALVPVADEAGHWLALLAFTALFSVVALWAMRRDEARER
ncbi:ABC transporter permease [Deinococcus lacus]|uniref:ABC transporter permease n=1 Tax=Deinococcus lacus TaxID=392561 RepID=A0ABW1YF07_9DEIO